MRLYEITTGLWGESYVRLYAWASSSADANVLARDALARAGRPRRISAALRIEELFNDAAAPFCTLPDDAGWVGPRTGPAVLV